MKYAFLFLFAVLTMVSCTSAEEVLEVPTPENTPQESVGYRFSINVGEPTTRVTYHDNIGGENSPYNPNADSSNKLTMSWRNGDELVAIRWKAPYDEYVVLKAEVAEGQETHSITFSAEDVAHFKTALEDGERFVLVHGDFVLDAGHKTDGKVDPVIAFPTSQVSKDGYASHIHHGGVVEGNALTFRNQDGTLENLRKHEYMVADCYVYMGEADASGNVPVTFSGEKNKYVDHVKMHIAHTLLRLTLFLPDEKFDNDVNNDLVAVSLTDEDAHPIFHRYFRMHPNEVGTTNYWKTSWNDNADHEENAYIRINLADEVTGKHGVSHTAINVFGSEDFNSKKPVVVKGTVGGKTGHYFTLYYSLPSRHMGLEGQGACALKVSAFTRTHAYTTKKTYGLPDDAMLPGQVVPLNVSFVDNINDQKAITDPELGFTFTPGFVYANINPDGKTWTYGVYQNQGQYAGMIHQTLDFGEYFTFGSKDPTQAGHWAESKHHPAVVPSPFVDVAEEVEIGGVKGLCHMLTKAEADRIMKRMQDEVKANGVFLGYYYYDDKGDNTKHKAPGSQQDSILKKAAAGGAKTVDELKAMSASVGIYVGRSTQPKFEEQDDYFFLPNAAQMHYDSSGTGVSLIETGGSGSGIGYYLPGEYKDLEATGDGLTKIFNKTFKFSTWLRDAKNSGFRMQVWTTDEGKALDTGRTNANQSDKKTYARPIRAIIY